MEIASEINIVLNVLTAALVAYTSRTLKHLRDELRVAAAEVERVINGNDGPNGTFHKVP